MKRAVPFLGRSIRGLLPQASDYTAMRRSPKHDLVAGLTVAIVALPLALAFGVASGMGAGAGLVTAVIAGILAAIFGGSNVQISGPTGAMTVVLLPVVSVFGGAGVLQVGLMAGILLVVLAVSGVGKTVRYLPVSLIEGFTAGIAVVIALQQLPSMLGVTSSGQHSVLAIAADAVQSWIAAPTAAAPLITIVVAGAVLLGARWKPGLPLSLAAIVIVSLVVYYGGISVPIIGELPPIFVAPTADFLDLSQWAQLVPSAVAVALLAALESLLCATVADGMTVGERHNPDRELLGQGIANLVVPFFGGVPATAAIARTAVSVRSGARSRLASITHSLVLLAIVLLAAPIVGEIPLAALAGVLLATTIQMIDVGAIRALIRASRVDAVVVITTFGVTVLVDLIAAVVVGLIVAALLALRSVAQAAQIEQVPLEMPLDADSASEQEFELLREHIVAYRLDGPLFFGAAHRFLLELTELSEVAVVILRLSRVTSLDATGALMLDDVVSRLKAKGVIVLLSGISATHDRMLSHLGVAAELRAAGRIFADTPEAIRYARAQLPGAAN